MQKEQQEEKIVMAKIAEITIGNRLRKEARDIPSLAKSISDVGLIHPIVLDQNMNLIAGFRRIKAYEYLSRSEIPARIVDISNPRQAEFDENDQRLGFTPSEVAAIFKAVQSSRIGHRPTKGEGGAENNDDNNNKVSKLDTFPKGSSLDVTHNITGLSRGNIANWIAVTDQKEQSPDEGLGLPYDNRTLAQLVEDVDSYKTSVSDAYKLVKKHNEIKKRRVEVAEAAKGRSLPEKVTLLPKDSIKVEEITEIEDGSVDLVLTDPPYQRETAAHYFGALARFALAKLKDGGTLVFYYGHILDPEVHEIFRKYAPELKYWGSFYVELEGPYSKLDTRNIIPIIKPMMCFVKGNKQPLWGNNNVPNYIKSKRPEKADHE